MLRRALLLAWLLAAAGLPARAGEVSETSSRDVSGVVELFTSQGCASCPPADKVLTELARDPRLVALAYHVDYWDYIGWRDTKASRDNGERQRGYAQTLKSGSVYTPQAVVNGRRDVMGAKEGEIRRAITETRLGGTVPTLTLAVRGGRLHVAAEGAAPPPASGGDRMPVLMLVTFEKWSETAVERGENEGHVLGSTNAVRNWRVLGMWDGKPLSLDLPLDVLNDNGEALGCALILQDTTPDGGPGPILAAAALVR